jgi:hypothetical protein
MRSRVVRVLVRSADTASSGKLTAQRACTPVSSRRSVSLTSGQPSDSVATHAPPSRASRHEPARAGHASDSAAGTGRLNRSRMRASASLLSATS